MQAHRREGRLNRVGGAQMLPVLGRVIEVGQQSVLVEGQRRDGLRILGAVRGAEAGDLALSGRAGLGVHDLVQRLLGPRLEALGELVQDVGDPVDPTALLCRLWRSEEHTSELQSLAYLVCRLLLEKKKNNMSCI